MGIQDKGAFGGFRNKTGPLVGHIVNGQNVITSVPAKSSKPPTQKQLDQRKKFGLVTSFLSWMSGLIDTGFQEREQRQSPMNKAVQYNLLNAVSGLSPDYAIDLTKLKFSVGKCPLPSNMSAQGIVGAKINFIWGISYQSKYGKDTDLVNLMVYNAEKDQFVILENAAGRTELGFALQLPADFVGDTVHCYLNFVSATGHVTSNSEYLGELIVA
ncbi:DUF6266 family protein [Pedobacter immunditicola]|uniref:DUF6266 family protein n=1 Tax=Pedobacter immunditicola TaxID=3133440 RepID=UPI0030B37364